MDYYRFAIRSTVAESTAEQREIILAFLGDLPFDTFEESETGWLAFGPVADWDDPDLARLDALGDQWHFTWEKTRIPAQNWNARWEANFAPIRVEQFCAIRADFHPPQTGVEHEIIINPKMAFGTGHHETTYLVLSLLHRLPLAGRRVLDYGCGTGVLAILAAKCGAQPVDAIDYDVLAYDNTLENCRVNATEGVRVFHGTLEKLHDRRYDLILANINRNVILAQLSALYSMVLPGGTLVVSGFLLRDRALLQQSAEREGFHFGELDHRNQWLCMRFHRNI
ncbi:MAG: 50S ribosomal protein L11 methyltransferase [Bacteroidota bacterium]